MKLFLEIDSNLEEDEVRFKVKEFNDEVKELYDLLNTKEKSSNHLMLYDDSKEYIINYNDIVFFETESDGVYAHTNNYAFQAKMRLYELENSLPSNFLRISKSAIININKIYSIEKRLSSTSLVQFVDTHKEVYVSRRYYRLLKDKLLERSRL
ncbi:LytTR family transcriptional regulator [Erysipelotrichaceae bacterium OttesenSCG-928-M19]|nr:LytTR family transcriptional regulator [Erysipelotrichaceae bacterium OttesenSCG-928-M19]